MKVGIISLYTDNTLNFGNILQTYALNHYIRTFYPDYDVETIRWAYSKKSTLKTKKMSVRVIYNKIKKRVIKYFINGDFAGKKVRLSNFSKFAKEYIPCSEKVYVYDDFRDLSYDVYIVGSDVVWSQYECGINRERFLDFTAKKSVRRIAYAASFGRDWIPKENINAIKGCLDQFDAISVREKSSVALLSSIGVNGVEHCVDPTLLSDKYDWMKLAIKPGEIDEEEYAFVYLLSEDRKQYEYIERFCHNNNLITVVIPFAAGTKIHGGGTFGDKQIKTCSPQNWIWLISHANYVFTDSFHGIIFSTIFEKCFFAFERMQSKEGNRLLDFLRSINEIDKLVTDEAYLNAHSFSWDFTKTHNIVVEWIKSSKQFLLNAIPMTEENKAAERSNYGGHFS